MSDSTKDPGTAYMHAHWERQLKDIDLEIVREAMLCEIPVTDRARLMRALENDASACGCDNPEAFQKLRAALAMHLHVRDKAIASMGREETQAIIDEVVAGLRRRLGLPDPPSP